MLWNGRFDGPRIDSYREYVLAFVLPCGLLCDEDLNLIFINRKTAYQIDR